MRSRMVTPVRRQVALAVTILMVAAALVWSAPLRADAFSVDAAGKGFTFDYSSGGNGTLVSGASPAANGAVVLFDTVATIDGVAIDAVVTTEVNGATISNYDNIGSASANANYFQVNMTSSAAGGYTAFQFDFYEHGSYSGPGTGAPVILLNVAVTSIDIDAPGQQFQDFVGYQSYVLNNPTNLTAVDKGAGVTRFEQAIPASHSNVPEDAVQVTFDAVSTFTAKFGNEQSGSIGYYGVTFEPLSVVYPGSNPAAPVDNPSNRPPTSADSTRYVPNNEAWTIQRVDFGPYADPDLNPLAKVKIVSLPTAGSLQKYVGGAWVPVVAGDDIAVADIENWNLRFTGAVDDSLTFRVNDGLAYSVATYTMDLLMSTQGQTITFANPGQKAPTDPAFASGATASSGLPVALESLTPGVCTVSGLDITPVSEGACTIVATQPGDRTYGAADPVTQTFSISTKTSQTITAPNPGDQTYTGSPSTITLSPTATSGLPVDLVSLTPDVCTVSGYVVTLVGPGNCKLRDAQAGDATYAPASPVQFTFAVTTAVSYTLTYDANSADSGTVPSSQTGSGSVTLVGNTGTLARAGYTFGGWDIGSTTYAGGDAYNLAASVTAFAIWTPVPATYTVTYDANGADVGSVPSALSGSGAATLDSNTGSLTRAGYTFAGWRVGGVDYAPGEAFTLTANETAYARWTAAAVAADTLAFTGSNPGPVVALSLGLLMAGVGFIVWGRLARRRHRAREMG